jgi:hypothetical protein
MSDLNLSDEQWCFLDLLMRAKNKGVSRINRHELLRSQALPDMARVKLVFAGLTIPTTLVIMHGQHDFEITDEGVRQYNAKFGTEGEPAEPTRAADMIIALPDRSREVLQ